MGVMMQAFYWDCPRHEGVEFDWWPVVRQRLPSLAQAGFTSLWLPPVHKPANIHKHPSMGYDPFDYWDLGDLIQRDHVPTWFGTRADLEALIADAHRVGLTVLADMVLNHNSGGDLERSPLDGKERWTLFTPASGRFPRGWDCFHPSNFESWDDGVFGEMPDLCHRNPYVYQNLMELARWLVEEIGFDGFRYDFVKGYGSWMVKAIQEYRYTRNGQILKPIGVGEEWSAAHEIHDWINEINHFSDNPVSALDFPNRYLLKGLCDQYGFSLRNLVEGDTCVRRDPFHTVTFVDNHDFRSEENPPIFNDKLLAYSHLLTHEGYPCVYWQDYYAFDLSREGTPNGIAALVAVHERLAGGEQRVLWVDDDFYVMQRSGHGAQPGLVHVLNNRGDRWWGEWVSTLWSDIRLEPVAWWSATDTSQPAELHTALDGRVQVWAPPRGYAVYRPAI